MKSRKIVNMALSTVLLSSMLLGAEHSSCTGGVCFATLSHSKSSKNLEDKQSFKQIEFIEEESLDTTIVLEVENNRRIVSIETYTIDEEGEMDLLLTENPMEVTEDRILEKTDLPTSDYFCEEDKQPVYLNNDIYECV